MITKKISTEIEKVGKLYTQLKTNTDLEVSNKIEGDPPGAEKMCDEDEDVNQAYIVNINTILDDLYEDEWQ